MGGRRFDTWPSHTKGVKIMPVTTLLGTQHYKASNGFSSLTNIAQLTPHKKLPHSSAHKLTQHLVHRNPSAAPSGVQSDRIISKSLIVVYLESGDSRMPGRGWVYSDFFRLIGLAQHLLCAPRNIWPDG